MSTTDKYIQLFGKDHIRDGDVVNYSEHGRAGGVDTGQPFKFVGKPEEKVVIDESTTGTTYVGKALIGTATSASSWQIKRIVEASDITTITHADGNDDYDNIWDSRSSLTYS